MPYITLTGADNSTTHDDLWRVADLFREAVEQRASDIHIRVSKRERTRIFFRVHNDMEFVHENTYEFGERLCSTIYQAMADVADATFETISRQDARISDKAKLPEKIDCIRIATAPQVEGFIMVLRLLYNDQGRKHIITVEDPPEYPILGVSPTVVLRAAPCRNPLNGTASASLAALKRP